MARRLNKVQGHGRLFAIALCFIALLASGLIVAARHWPFTRAAVEKALTRDLHAPVTIGRFRQTWLPHPGCIAEQVQAGNQDFALKIDRLSIEGAYSAFIRGAHELERVRVQGGTLHWRSKPDSKNGSSTLVKEFIIERSTLQHEPNKEGDQPLRIQIHRAVIRRSSPDGPIAAEGTFHYPKPDGEMWVRVGLDTPSGSDAVLTGEYRFDRAQLGVFKGIAGMLTSHGKFAGPLRRVAIDGTAEVPDFEVTRSEHPVRLDAEFHAVADGTNGDTFLETVETTFGGTRIHWNGDIRGQNGKVTALEMVSERARIQDLLFLVLHSDRPSMTGPIAFRARVLLPPGKAAFIERLQLDGDFGIEGQFSSSGARKGVAELSAHARGDKESFDDPENVLSDLQGHVRLRGATAQLTRVSFRVPGAVALLDGSYDLLSHRVNLHGQLRMQSELSGATKGVKSFLLKAVDPLFKRKGAGAVVPVSITGVYPHPVYSVLGLHKGT